MEKQTKVNIFLGILIAGAIIIAIFALSNTEESQQVPFQDYEEEIRDLQNAIKELKDDITRYEREINTINLERIHLKEELDQILRDNEKVDTELTNSDWDGNIKFLTDFLSEESGLED